MQNVIPTKTIHERLDAAVSRLNEDPTLPAVSVPADRPTGYRSQEEALRAFRAIQRQAKRRGLQVELDHEEPFGFELIALGRQQRPSPVPRVLLVREAK